MKVLFFGDTYGRPGREALRRVLTQRLHEWEPDYVVVNAENFCHGHGILPEMADEFLNLGVDVLTTGNHAWDQRQIVSYMQDSDRCLRPANYPNGLGYMTPGRGSTIVECARAPVGPLGVVQVMGRVFMDALDCPFQAAEREVMELKKEGVRAIIVDFHGEATSEKQAFGWFMDGKVSGVFGTHSHVQTSDERIFPMGTAYITDVGMTGCYDSVIGVKKEISIERFLTKRPVRFEPAEGIGGFAAVLVEIHPTTGKALKITRLFERECQPTS